MRAFGSALAIALAAASSAAAAAQPPPEASVYGVWIGKHKNVKVQTKPCGKALCGSVVWATPDALQEARNSGTDNLIGLQLFSGYHRTSDGDWEGKVFVPDLKRTFYSRIKQVGPDQLRISGCILGGLICKYQTWTRTDD